MTEEGTESETVQQALRNEMPAYMVPAFFETLEALPVTPNGSLTAARFLSRRKAHTGRAFTEPESDMEKELSAIWSEVLGTENIAADQSFLNWAAIPSKPCKYQPDYIRQENKSP